MVRPVINPSAINLAALPRVEYRKRKNLPREAAIYFVTDGVSEIFYIGETDNLFRRFLSHSHQHHFKNACSTPMVSWLSTGAMKRWDRREIERQLIRAFMPKFNGVLKRLCDRTPVPLSQKTLSALRSIYPADWREGEIGDLSAKQKKT